MSDKSIETKKKLLLALYSKAQAAFLKKGFEESGFSVVTANDGIHAIQLASTVHPDCALVCTDLPVLDAYAFTRIIKNTDYLRDIAVVIGTTDDNENFRFWTDNCKSDAACPLSSAGTGQIIETVQDAIEKYKGLEKGGKKNLSSSVSFIKLMGNAYDKEMYGLYVTREAYKNESKRYDLKELVQSMIQTLRSILEFDAFSMILKGDRLVEIYSFSDRLANEELEDFRKIARADFEAKAEIFGASGWQKSELLEHKFTPVRKEKSKEKKIRSYEKFPLDGDAKDDIPYIAHVGLCKDLLSNRRTRERVGEFISIYAPLIQKTIEFNQIAEAEHRVEKAFSRFLPPSVIKGIIKDEKSFDEGAGEKRQVAILMADIRNFTAISEKNSPENVVDFLNMFFAKMGKIIKTHGGMIDKFMGDAIMALFGAPESYIYNGNRAANAALEMSLAAKQMDTSILNMGDKKFRIGIGINYGTPIVGALGSDDKKEYTVIGDDVNLASRVESLTKLYGSDILITESVKKDIDAVREAVKEKELPASEEDSLPHLIRHIDNVKVKGKTHAVRIYAMSTDMKKFSHSFLDNYRKGLNQYEIGNFKTAVEYFSLANEEYPNDMATQELLSRCKGFSENKPLNWDGAVALTRK
ncbi:MAG: adenylate/guanylate cyclase domain-containing response regulator [Treponema sp.]|nr:adenylate/guanylate cyclase domain-containing response regulator [Treponema sp.]